MIFFALEFKFRKGGNYGLGLSFFTRDLDDKYGWNDPFLTSRTLHAHGASRHKELSAHTHSLHVP